MEYIRWNTSRAKEWSTSKEGLNKLRVSSGRSKLEELFVLHGVSRVPNPNWGKQGVPSGGNRCKDNERWVPDNAVA